MTASSSCRARLRSRTFAVGIAASALVTAAVVPAIASVAQASSHPRPAAARNLPAVAGSRYLALGDSVSFGYREPNSIPAPNFTKATHFTGFPEDVAANLGLRLTNAACPGETTASFLNTKAQSNGCENFLKGQAGPAYRPTFPLHARYASKTQSQLAFALAFLKKYPNTRLVTIMIGANDGFLCVERTADQCFSEIPAVQKVLTKNIAVILKALRTRAHYAGQIVLVDYYSTNYADGLSTIEAQDINNALISGTKGYNVTLANGFNQFQRAAAQAKGNTCTAQLLTALTSAPTKPCGVHPSYAGAALLAQAVEQVTKK